MSYSDQARGQQQPQAAIPTIAPTTAVVPSGEGRRGNRSRDSDVQNLPLRPVVAKEAKTLGKPVQLTCNHFRFLIGDKTIYQYVVKFQPEIISKKTRITLVRTHTALLGNEYVFDGTMLFTQKAIDDQELRTPLGEKTVLVQIVRTKELDPKTSDVPDQLYNIIFKKILYLLGLKPIGRQHYNPKRKKDVPQHKVELWPGYFTSIGAGDLGMMLNVDFTHKILRTDSVLEYFYEISSKAKNWKETAEQELVGQIVLTRYGKTERTYRIDEIAWERTPADQFPKDGKPISYEEYYSRVYNLKLQDPNQPLLLSRRRRRGQDDQLIFLIPELCSMTGLTEQMRADFHVMRDISRHTRVGADVRAAEIEAFITAANTNEGVKKEFGSWNIRVDDKMLTVTGKALEPEKILFQNNRPFTSPNADWGKLNRDPFIQPISLNEWILVYTKRDTQNADMFVDTFKKVAQPCGVRVPDPIYGELNDDASRSYVNTIKSNLTQNTQLVVCILPTTKKERYDEIKKACCIASPVPSQCVVAKSLAKNTMSVVTKIMFQINCKLGGQLWRVEIPVPKAMVIGMDVCHDTLQGRRSVAGFCASLNGSFTQYYSRVSFQDSRQEVIDGLKTCMTGALAKFYKVNNMLPERVLVFRDGVGDGQLKVIVEHELPQYFAAFSSINVNYKPKLTVVIVKKRIHTRIFSSFQGKLANPPPGTIVDSGATHKGWYDYFLVSQSVREGTVTPTHYHVIYDDSGLRPDYLQTLTFKLCHLYYNWPGTVRVPAPCQYAHKISFLVGQSLHEDPAEALRDKLYFL